MNKIYRRYLGKSGRLFRIFSPFALLVIGLAAIYFISTIAKSKSENEAFNIIPSPSVIATGNANTRIPASRTSRTIATVTATQRSAKIETTPQPSTPPANAQIQLIGPPPDSSFYLDDPISTIWTWSLPQDTGQHFAIYLVTDENEYLAGTVKDPSLGAFGYQLTYLPSDVLSSEGTYHLQIRLQQTRPQVDLVTSVPRALTFINSIPR